LYKIDPDPVITGVQMRWEVGDLKRAPVGHHPARFQMALRPNVVMSKTDTV